jgi:enoyl-CoA hydratase/carnithine racemase
MWSAEQAMADGLVDFVGEAEALHSEVEKTCSDILKQSARAIRDFKKILVDANRTQMEAALALEAKYSQNCLRDEDTLKRVHEFLNRKKKK